MKTTEPVIRNADWQHDQGTLKHIRKTVFIEEQKVPEDLEWDGLDPECTHFLAFIDHHAVATARIKPDGHIGRMAVLQPYRNIGVGSKLLSTIIQHAIDTGLCSVYLHAQISAVGFYKKHGFTAQSPEFSDAGIMHRTMVKILR